MVSDSTVSFDEWNRRVTAEICVRSDLDTAKNVRRARSGAMARWILFDDYEEWCEANGVVPEAI